MLRIGSVAAVIVAAFLACEEAKAEQVVELSGTASQSTLVGLGSCFAGVDTPARICWAAMSPGQDSFAVRDEMMPSHGETNHRRVTIAGRPGIYGHLSPPSQYWIDVSGDLSGDWVPIEPGDDGVTFGGITFTTWLTEIGRDTPSASVPAISDLGIVVMLVGLAAVGGVVFGRSKRGVVAAQG